MNGGQRTADGAEMEKAVECDEGVPVWSHHGIVKVKLLTAGNPQMCEWRERRTHVSRLPLPVNHFAAANRAADLSKVLRRIRRIFVKHHEIGIQVRGEASASIVLAPA